jgi:peptide deformylase
MKSLEIKKFNESVLRRKCEEVENITSEIKELVLDMEETMKKNQGIGLAANQVGISKRIIMVQIDLRGSKVIGLINPRIVKKGSEKEIREEGCLSFPNISLDIKRSKEIEIEALDISGQEIKMKAKGLSARVIQHEIDHLDGILFFNRLGFFQKIKFKLKHPFLRIWI